MSAPYRAKKRRFWQRRNERLVKINEFLHRARAGRVRIVLDDGQVHIGHFRTDILSASALSAFFFGDERPLSLSIADIVSVDALAAERVAS
jgi:hypothetical protein